MTDDVVELTAVAATALGLASVVTVLHYEAIVRLGVHYGRLRRKYGQLGRSVVLRVFAAIFALHVAEIWLFGIAQSLPENIAPFVFSAGIILVSLSLAFVMRQRGSATRRSDNWSGNSTE